MRESAAAATKAAILDTAEALFAEHGYPHVTIKSIADRAGVATGTVYAAFGSKPALVAALTARAADDPGIGDVLAAVESATDGQEVVRLVVSQTCDLVRHHHRTMTVLAEAAAIDQDIAVLLRETEDLQRARFGDVAEQLGRLGALRPGVTRRDAVRILEYFVTPPSWHRMLHIGWDWEGAHMFLREAVCSALLR
ncbi:TetR/AcrR family transcriptional regulator [Streptomyces sp. NPDC097727]|uniref:TetR/AcrR family transcriptional regulator n=1 Tax=Streptomyces sp. NPDC097727 TaxID=3366092 RepID=UPI0038112264